MPWRYPHNIPKVAKNWTPAEQRKCTAAANAVLAKGGSEQDAIFACIRAAGKSKKQSEVKMDKQEFDKLTIEQKLNLYYQFLDRELAGEEGVWDTDEAKWTRAFINGLSDASFAAIEPAYRSGKDKNKNARHLPHHAAISKHSLTNVDKPHLRNALARMNQIKPVTGSISASDLQSRAKTHLVPHAKKVLPDSQWAKEELAVHYFAESAGAGPRREPLTETIFTVLELREADDGYHHARLLLTHGDKLNKNNRVYGMPIWNQEIPRVKPAVLEGSFVGMANHPGFFRGEDILATVVKFTDLWTEGKDVYGDVIVIPTTAGKDVIELAKAKVKIGVSSRGHGTAVKQDWTDPETGEVHKDVNVIQDDYELIAFDLVSRPSVKDAKVVHFEHFADPGMTVEKLAVCWSELVASTKELAVTEALEEAGFESFEAIKDKIEVQAEAIKRLHEEKHELELKRGSLLETRDAILGIFDIQAEPNPFVKYEKPIKEARQQLLDEKQALTERLGARDHLIEKVKGEKAAWLILLKLWEAESAADVDAQYESAKDQAELMLGRGAAPSGKGKMFVEGDDTEDISEAERKQRILRASGLAP